MFDTFLADKTKNPSSQERWESLILAKDEEKTKEHLINELVELRQRIAGLKKSEDECKEAVEALKYRIRFQELIIESYQSCTG